MTANVVTGRLNSPQQRSCQWEPHGQEIVKIDYSRPSGLQTEPNVPRFIALAAH